MMSHWNPGEKIVIRGLWRGKIWWAMPVTVVRDDPGLIAIYWQAGTPNKHPSRRVSPGDLLTIECPQLIDDHWIDTDVLMLVPPAAYHAIYAMWEAGTTRLNCWYVNLQSPFHRTTVGFDSDDYMLDIVIDPDLRNWRWKDEDEFQEAVALGVYSREQAQEIRAEGETVIRQMQAGTEPFHDGWETWSPPGDWEIPGFPPGWDNLEE